MNDDRKAEIEKLAGILFDKRRYYHNLGMMQTPTDPEEAKKSAQAYAVAEAEMYDAEKALRDVQHWDIIIQPITRRVYGKRMDREDKGT